MDLEEIKQKIIILLLPFVEPVSFAPFLWRIREKEKIFTPNIQIKILK